MIIGNILFFLMMLAPRSWQFVKMPLVAMAVVLLASHYIRQGSRVCPNKIIVIWFVVLLAYGIIWSTIGVLNGNPGVSDFFRINVVWTILYALFVFYVDTIKKYNSLLKTMVWATVAVSLYNIAIVLSAIGILPNVNNLLKIDGELTSAIGIYSGFIQLQSHNIGSLTFLSPFLLCVYVIKQEAITGISRRLLAVAVILSIVAVLVSGRRALWLEMIVAPLILFVFGSITRGETSVTITKKVARFYLAAILVLLAAGFGATSYTNWNYKEFQDRFTSAFVEEDVRQQQGAALFRGFQESPFIGSGFGIGVHDVVRDDEHPWNYETSYLLILYNTGVLGSLLYGICLAMVFYVGLRCIRNGSCDEALMLPLLVAFSCFIIANATNPYFASYDFMWVLFLPMSYLNIMLTKQKHV